jgi:hypothetical protein
MEDKIKERTECIQQAHHRGEISPKSEIFHTQYIPVRLT